MIQHKNSIALDHRLSLKTINIFCKTFLENNHFYLLVNEIDLEKKKLKISRGTRPLVFHVTPTKKKYN